MNNANNTAAKTVNVRRFEKGESYVQFTFEGTYAKMRNTLLERDEMTRSKALDRIATLERAGWVEVDAC